jgi:hypothetical protein
MTNATLSTTKPTRIEAGVYAFHGLTISQLQSFGGLVWYTVNADNETVNESSSLKSATDAIEGTIDRAFKAVAYLDANPAPIRSLRLLDLEDAKRHLTASMSALVSGHFSFTTSVENRPAWREGEKDITLESCLDEMTQQLEEGLAKWQTALGALTRFKQDGWSNADLEAEQDYSRAVFDRHYAIGHLESYSTLFGTADPAGLGDAIAEYLVQS